MKLNQKILKKIILEVLEDAPAVEEPDEVSSRVQRAGKATETGAVMPPEEYAQLLKQTLLTPKVTSQNRLKALESIFPGKGTTINALILNLAKQMEQGA